MAQTYSEYLLANGATPDDVNILDTPVARKAYDSMQAKADAAERKAATDLEARRLWADQVEEANQKYLRERDTALADTAAANARLAKLQELGLIEVAEKIEPGSTKPKEGETPAFDPKTYNLVDRDTLMQVAEREGDAIAIAQDISFEHQQLFGGDPAKRLNFRELRKEAVARKVPVESLWMEKYGVQAARDTRAAKEKTDYENRIADEAVTKYKSEHSQDNPLTVVPTVSKNTFTDRLPSAVSDAKKQPWNMSDGEKEQARMARVVKKLNEQGLVQ